MNTKEQPEEYAKAYAPVPENEIMNKVEEIILAPNAMSEDNANHKARAICSLFQQASAAPVPGKEESYWQRRCEAAELIIGISGTVDCEGYEQWETLKEQEPGSPSTASNEDKGEVIRTELLAIMKENLDDTVRAKEKGWKDILTSSDPFDCIIETYHYLISIIENLPLKRQPHSKEFLDKVDEPKAVQQAAKELYPDATEKDLPKGMLPFSNSIQEERRKAFLAGASFNSTNRSINLKK